MTYDSDQSPRLRTPTPPGRSPAGLATKVAKRGSDVFLSATSAAVARLRGEAMKAAARRRLRDLPHPRRLCLGSGQAPIPGWVNIDFEPPADILIDLRCGLPVVDGSIDVIYSEHLIEHLPLEAAEELLLEWRRVITSEGVVRIATPDLERLITDYRGDWRSRHEWIKWPEYANIDSPVRMINVAMRAWGHQYLYDFEELASRLHAAGFSDVRRVSIGESADPALRNLETRADSSLVVEARP